MSKNLTCPHFFGCFLCPHPSHQSCHHKQERFLKGDHDFFYTEIMRKMFSFTNNTYVASIVHTTIKNTTLNTIRWNWQNVHFFVTPNISEFLYQSGYFCRKQSAPYLGTSTPFINPLNSILKPQDIIVTTDKSHLDTILWKM